MSASESLQPPLQSTWITVNPCWVEAMIVGLFVPAETEHFRGNSDLWSCPVSSSCLAWSLAWSYEHCLSSFPAASCLLALTSFPVSEHNLDNIILWIEYERHSLFAWILLAFFWRSHTSKYRAVPWRVWAFYQVILRLLTWQPHLCGLGKAEKTQAEGAPGQGPL